MSRCRFCHKKSPAHAQRCPHDKLENSAAMQDWIQGCREAEQGQRKDKDRFEVAGPYGLGWLTGQLRLLNIFKPSV